MNDEYKKAFQKDKDIVDKYFANITKSEQQKFLEELLEKLDLKNIENIGDIGCGGGKCSFHLNKRYSNSNYYLVDYNEDAINMAKNINQSNNFNFYVDDIYKMPFEDNFFDLTVCLVVTPFIEDSKKAIDEIIRTTKKNGHFIISALVNIDHDVDLLTKVLDKTRESSKSNLYYTYNTFSKTTFESWFKDKTTNLEFIKFSPSIDFVYDGKGIDTFTMNTDKEKIQLAGGMLLNWAFIHGIKE